MADNIQSTLTYNAKLEAAMAEVKALTARITALNASMNSLNDTAVRTRAVTAGAFASSISSAGDFTVKMAKLTTAAEDFGNRLKANKLTMREYFAEAIKGYTKQDSLMRQLARNQVRYMESMAVGVGRGAGGKTAAMMLVPNEIDIRNATTKMNLLNQQFTIFRHLVKQGAEEMINFGKNTQWTGRQLTVGLTMPVVLFGATFAKTFMSIDKELTRFAKVYGQDLVSTNAAATAKMKEQVIDLARTISSQYGIAASETAALAADIAATGKEGQALLDTVAQTSRLAVLGEVDRQDAMKATLAIQTAFKQNTKELSDSINFLNAVENQTSTTLNDLVEAIPKAGPVVKGLGGSIKDLSVLMVAMKEGGIPAAEAANAIKSGLASLINPTKKASEVAKQFGVDLAGIVNANKGQLMPTLLAVQSALDGLDSFSKSRIIEEIFGKYQFARISALFNNLGKAGSQTEQAMKLAGASTTQLASIANKELKAYTESTTVRFQRMVETIKNQLLPLGETLLKTFVPVLEKVSGFIDGLSGLLKNIPQPLKDFGATLGGLALVAGPVLMLVGLFKQLIGNGLKGVMAITTLGARLAGIKTGKLEVLDEHAMAAKLGIDNLNKSFESQEKTLSRLRNELALYQESLRRTAAISPELFVPYTPSSGGRPAGTRRAPIRRQRGGGIPGYGGGDIVPTMLEPGEFVVRKEATRGNENLLRQINQGSVGAFKIGSSGKQKERGQPESWRQYTPPEARDLAREQSVILARFLGLDVIDIDPKSGRGYIMVGGRKVSTGPAFRQGVESSHFTSFLEGIDEKGQKIWNAKTVGTATGVENQQIQSILGVPGFSGDLSAEQRREKALQLPIALMLEKAMETLITKNPAKAKEIRKLFDTIVIGRKHPVSHEEMIFLRDSLDLVMEDIKSNKLEDKNGKTVRRLTPKQIAFDIPVLRGFLEERIADIEGRDAIHRTVKVGKTSLGAVTYDDFGTASRAPVFRGTPYTMEHIMTAAAAGSPLSAEQIALGRRRTFLKRRSGGSVPALVEPGEFIINKESAKKYGPFLRALNSGMVKRFETGDEVLAHGTSPLDVPVSTLMTRGQGRIAPAVMAQLRSLPPDAVARLFSNLVFNLPTTMNTNLKDNVQSRMGLISRMQDPRSFAAIMEGTGLTFAQLSPVVQSLTTKLRGIDSELIGDRILYSALGETIRELRMSGDHAAGVLDTLSRQYGTYAIVSGSESSRQQRERLGAGFAPSYKQFGPMGFVQGRMGERSFIDMSDLVHESVTYAVQDEMISLRQEIAKKKTSVTAQQREVERLTAIPAGTPMVGTVLSTRQQQLLRDQEQLTAMNIRLAQLQNQDFIMRNSARSSVAEINPALLERLAQKSAAAQAEQQQKVNARRPRGDMSMRSMNALMGISALSGMLPLMAGGDTELSNKLFMASLGISTAASILPMIGRGTFTGNLFGLGTASEKLKTKALERFMADPKSMQQYKMSIEREIASGKASPDRLRELRGIRASGYIPTSVSEIPKGGVGSKLAGAAGLLGMAGGVPGMIAVGAIAAVTAGIIAYKNASEEARRVAVAAFAEPAKTAEFFGMTLKPIVDRMRDINSEVEGISQVDSALREAVKADYGDLINKIKYAGAAGGARELAIAFNNMLINGLDKQGAIDAIKAIAAEAGAAGGRAFDEAMTSNMLSAKNPEEALKKYGELFTNNAGTYQKASSELINTINEYNQLSNSPLNPRGFRQSPLALGSFLPIQGSTVEDFLNNPNLQNNVWNNAKTTYQSGALSAFSGIKEEQVVINRLAELLRSIMQQVQDLQAMSADFGDNLSQITETLFASYKNAPELTLQTFDEITSTIDKSKLNIASIQESLINIDPVFGSTLATMINGNADLAVLVEKAVAANISFTDIITAINNKALNALIASRSLADQAAMDIANLRASTLGRFGKQFEKALKKGQTAYDELVQQKNDYIKSQQDASAASQQIFEDEMQRLDDEKEAISRSADAYIKSLQKRADADNYYANRKKQNLTALQALAGGDVFGFINARNETQQLDAQYSYDQEIKRIEERRDAEIQAINDIQKEKDRANQKSQQGYQADLDAWVIAQDEKIQTQAENNKTLQELIDQANTDQISSYKDVTAALGEELGKQYEDSVKQMLRDTYNKLISSGKTQSEAISAITQSYSDFVGIKGLGPLGIPISNESIIKDLGLVTPPNILPRGYPARPSGANATAADLAPGLYNLGTQSMTVTATDTTVNVTGDVYLVTGATTTQVSTEADGGYISGPGGPREDKIPARLSNGEYVIKADSVDKYGRVFLDQINNGVLNFATGGIARFSVGGTKGGSGGSFPAYIPPPYLNPTTHTTVASEANITSLYLDSVGLLRPDPSDIISPVLKGANAPKFSIIKAIQNIPDIIKMFIGRNPLNLARTTTSELALRSLAKSDNTKILELVASNPATPADVLDMLSQSSSRGVRRSVGINPNVPYEIALRLSDDPSKLVRRSAGRFIDSPELAQKRLGEIRLSNLLRDPETPMEVLMDALYKNISGISLEAGREILIRAGMKHGQITKIRRWMRDNNLSFDSPETIESLTGQPPAVGTGLDAIAHATEVLKAVDEVLVRYQLKPGPTPTPFATGGIAKFVRGGSTAGLAPASASMPPAPAFLSNQWFADFGSSMLTGLRTGAAGLLQFIATGDVVNQDPIANFVGGETYAAMTPGEKAIQSVLGATNFIPIGAGAGIASKATLAGLKTAGIGVTTGMGIKAIGSATKAAYNAVFDAAKLKKAMAAAGIATKLSLGATMRGTDIGTGGLGRNVDNFSVSSLAAGREASSIVAEQEVQTIKQMMATRRLGLSMGRKPKPRITDQQLGRAVSEILAQTDEENYIDFIKKLDIGSLDVTEMDSEKLVKLFLQDKNRRVLETLFGSDTFKQSLVARSIERDNFVTRLEETWAATHNGESFPFDLRNINPIIENQYGDMVKKDTFYEIATRLHRDEKFNDDFISMVADLTLSPSKAKIVKNAIGRTKPLQDRYNSEADALLKSDAETVYSILTNGVGPVEIMRSIFDPSNISIDLEKAILSGKTLDEILPKDPTSDSYGPTLDSLLRLTSQSGMGATGAWASGRKQASEILPAYKDVLEQASLLSAQTLYPKIKWTPDTPIQLSRYFEGLPILGTDIEKIAGLSREQKDALIQRSRQKYGTYMLPKTEGFSDTIHGGQSGLEADLTKLMPGQVGWWTYNPEASSIGMLDMFHGGSNDVLSAQATVKLKDTFGWLGLGYEQELLISPSELQDILFTWGAPKGRNIDKLKTNRGTQSRIHPLSGSRMDSSFGSNVDRYSPLDGIELTPEEFEQFKRRLTSYEKFGTLGPEGSYPKYTQAQLLEPFNIEYLNGGNVKISANPHYLNYLGSDNIAAIISGAQQKNADKWWDWDQGEYVHSVGARNTELYNQLWLMLHDMKVTTNNAQVKKIIDDLITRGSQGSFSDNTEISLENIDLFVKALKDPKSLAAKSGSAVRDAVGIVESLIGKGPMYTDMEMSNKFTLWKAGLLKSVTAEEEALFRLMDKELQSRIYKEKQRQSRISKAGLGLANGGSILGYGTATSDSIPAMLSNGEYVIKASSVDKYGIPFMDQLNAGMFNMGGLSTKYSIPQYNTGGPAQSFNTTGDNYNNTFNITVNADGVKDVERLADIIMTRIDVEKSRRQHSRSINV